MQASAAEPVTQFGDVAVACIPAPLKRIKAVVVGQAYNCPSAVSSGLNINCYSCLDTQFQKLVRYKHSFGLCR